MKAVYYEIWYVLENGTIRYFPRAYKTALRRILGLNLKTLKIKKHDTL